MDLLEAKSRIAEALVASIFRRARYDVQPFRPGQPPLRFGRENFSPDFRITQRLDDGDEQKYLVAVKCRPSAEQFISVENQRGNRSIFHMMRRHWPTLYFVLVTERPGAGRSCFQVLAFDTVRQGEPFRMVDLVEIKEFGVFAATPDRTDGVDHPARGQRVAACQAHVAGGAAAEPTTLLEQPWPRRPMNGAVDAAAAEQARVRGVDDRVHVQRRDVFTHQ